LSEHLDGSAVVSGIIIRGGQTAALWAFRKIVYLFFTFYFEV